MSNVDPDLLEKEFVSFSRSLAQNRVCPYTTKSMGNGNFKVVTFTKSFTAGDFLRSCIIETEWLRERVIENSLGNLYVTNVIFSDWDKPRELVNWVHWILKVAYTSEALMFGKFVKNSSEITKRKKAKITPPCSFVSIRETVGKLDYSLLDDEYAKILKNAKPSSDDVLLNKFGRTTSDLLSCDPQEALKYMVEKSGGFIND